MEVKWYDVELKNASGLCDETLLSTTASKVKN